MRWDLAGVVDRAVESPHYLQDDLSDLLANAGVLPMFGFPSRSRALYRGRPAKREEEGAMSVSDRPLDMAISSFSPGSEIAKDKEIHLAVGFAAYEQRFGKLAPTDPMGPNRPIWRCQECQAMEVEPQSPEATCAVCGGMFEATTLYEPLGFRTDYSPRDYEDQAERGSFGSAPQITGLSGFSGNRIRAALARTAPETPIYTINDNDGELFEMYRFDGTVVVPGPELYRDEPHLPRKPFERDPDFTGAIGAVKPSDVLVIELDQLDLLGGRGPLVVADSNPAALPALWSFAEMLRVAAAVELDVDARELEVGLQPYPCEGGASRRIFIADALENGSGYANRLGQTDTLEKVLDQIVHELGPKLSGGRHGTDCDGSCPDCLRSYDNRRLHSMLDWRLGLDLAELAADRPLREDRWLRDGDRITRGLAQAFALKPLELASLWGAQETRTSKVAILGHPAWTSADGHRSGDQLDAERAVLDGSSIRHWDLYTALRWPDRVMAWLQSA